MLLAICALEKQFSLTPSITNALARDHGRVLQHILVSVAMCRNPACPRFLWISQNWIFSGQHVLQPLQDLIHGLCMAHSDILEIKTFVTKRKREAFAAHLTWERWETLRWVTFCTGFTSSVSPYIFCHLSKPAHVSSNQKALHVLQEFARIFHYLSHQFVQFRPVQFGLGQNVCCLFHCVACIVEVFCDDLSHCTIRLWMIMSYDICRNESFEPCDFHRRKLKERSMWWILCRIGRRSWQFQKAGSSSYMTGCFRKLACCLLVASNSSKLDRIVRGLVQ